MNLNHDQKFLLDSIAACNRTLTRMRNNNPDNHATQITQIPYWRGMRDGYIGVLKTLHPEFEEYDLEILSSVQHTNDYDFVYHIEKDDSNLIKTGGECA